MVVLSIPEIEQVCNEFFAGTTPSSHVQSTNYQLETFLNDPECTTSSLLLIKRATSHYSIYFGALGLARSYMKPSVGINQSNALMHKSELLKFVLEKPLPMAVLTSVCKAYACLVKRAWLMKVNKEYPMQDIMGVCASFDEKPIDHKLVLLAVLTNIVNVMLTIDKNASYIIQALHQRVSINFKRSHLVPIFALSVKLIRQFSDDISTLNSFSLGKTEMLERSLTLCKECFAMDSHEANLSDDVSESLNMSANTLEWNEAFSTKSIEALFKLVINSKVEVACECLCILANFCSTRSSRFESKDRCAFLKTFLNGTLDIMKNHSIKLGNQQFYHSFFRLVAIIKGNNRVRELQTLVDYDEFLRVLKDLTLSGIKTMQGSSNNLLYTISSWKPIVSSELYSKSPSTNRLPKYIQHILEAFVTERLAFFEQVVVSGAEDPLDDPSSLSQMLDIVSTLSDICSSEFGRFLLNCFDPLFEQLQSTIKTLSPNELKTIESRITWLVHVLGCVTSGSSDSPKAMSRKTHSAMAIFRIFKLVAYLKDASSSRGFEKLEVAIIAFLAKFENTYIQALSPQAARMYRELNDLCGISNERELMRIVLNKIVSNLTQFSKSYSLISVTLTFLSDLIVDTSSSRLIQTLDETSDFLRSCTRRNLPFLQEQHDHPDCLKIMKCRTKLFAAIGQICDQRLEDTRDENEFIDFVRPFVEAMDNARNRLANHDNSKEIQYLVAGLARDMRGFCSSLTSTTSYSLFLDCIHGKSTDAFATALERFATVPEVTSAILRLLEELSTDRATRFNFPVFSRHGINLVRFVTQSIYSFATNLINLQVSQEELYAKRLKSASICLRIIYLIISQSIVNLGVFEVYNDHCVGNALEALAALCLRIQPENELPIYPKLIRSYFTLMQELAISKIDFFTSLSPQVFSYVVITIRVGLNMPDANIVMRSCSVMFSILMYTFDCVSKRKRSSDSEQIIDLVR